MLCLVSQGATVRRSIRLIEFPLRCVCGSYVQCVRYAVNVSLLCCVTASVRSLTTLVCRQLIADVVAETAL